MDWRKLRAKSQLMWKFYNRETDIPVFYFVSAEGKKASHFRQLSQLVCSHNLLTHLHFWIVRAGTAERAAAKHSLGHISSSWKLWIASVQTQTPASQTKLQTLRNKPRICLQARLSQRSGRPNPWKTQQTLQALLFCPQWTWLWWKRDLMVSLFPELLQIVQHRGNFCTVTC